MWNSNSADTEHEPSQFSYCGMGLVEGMEPAYQSCSVQLPYNWARSSPEIFFPQWVWYPIPVSKLINDLGIQTNDVWVQTDNMFSPSTQCKKGKTIDLHNKTFLPKSFEIGFHSIIRGLSAATPRIWYASLFAKPRGRYQPFRAKVKISYTDGKLGPHSMQWRRFVFSPSQSSRIKMTEHSRLHTTY